ncbi:serine/threonine protein phosphatase, partial [Pseudomonas putida]
PGRVTAMGVPVSCAGTGPLCGLVSRLGCAAAPAMCASALKFWGCCAAQSRHKAAPT